MNCAVLIAFMIVILIKLNHLRLLSAITSYKLDGFMNECR